MANWLKPFGAPPAAKTQATPASHEFGQKLAEFKKAHGFRERYTMHCYCSRYGRPFEVVFAREGEDKRFRVEAINKLAEQSGSAGSAARPVQKKIDVRELDQAGWACPYCRSDSWVHCHCGVSNCAHRLNASGGTLHKCEPGCGSEGHIVPMKEFTASPAGGAPKATTASNRALPGAVRPGLPSPGAPRLPGIR